MADLNTSSDSLFGRVKSLNQQDMNLGGPVVYVMSRDQRVDCNHALLAAQKTAQKMNRPLEVVFVINQKTGNRARQHYEFMLSGHKQLSNKLLNLNIAYTILGPSSNVSYELLAYFKKVDPTAVFFDMNPLVVPRLTQDRIAKNLAKPVFLVDTHNIVPVWIASDKQELAARTIRPKINKLLAKFMIRPQQLAKHNIGTATSNFDKSSFTDFLRSLPSNGQSLGFESGEAAAKVQLQKFITQKLNNYDADKNDPNKQGLSQLSPYLHFGQVSALEVSLAVESSRCGQQAKAAFLEELIIRKELSDNFCWYNTGYKSLSSAPAWAHRTLADHKGDPRDHLYSYEQLERAETHDPAWNACQREMTLTGKMHGYMRMYWAKKVLEWSKTPEQALETLIKLNDFYSLDGGDPNGYVGILWSVGGLHDRPWPERPIYGSVRSMVYSGLKRKFDVDLYQDTWL